MLGPPLRRAPPLRRIHWSRKPSRWPSGSHQNDRRIGQTLGRPLAKPGAYLLCVNTASRLKSHLFSHAQRDSDQRLLLTRVTGVDPESASELHNHGDFHIDPWFHKESLYTSASRRESLRNPGVPDGVECREIFCVSKPHVRSNDFFSCPFRVMRVARRLGQALPQSALRWRDCCAGICPARNTKPFAITAWLMRASD